MLTSGAELLDGEKQQKLYNTFLLPTDEDKKAVKRGDYVKVMVTWRNGHASERFWVRVTKIGQPGFVGIINNDLLFTSYHGLADKDQIKFNINNIVGLIKIGPPPHPIHPVGKMLVNTGTTCKHVNNPYIYEPPTHSKS